MTTQQQEPVAPLMNEPVPDTTMNQIGDWFTHHPPTLAQTTQYQRIRDAGRFMALTIVQNVPPSADRTAAIRKVREAVMTANAAIACGGR